MSDVVRGLARRRRARALRQMRLAGSVERHRSGRLGWLRAAVLGADDGIVSTASLLVGISSASGSRSTLVITGIARRRRNVDGCGRMGVGQFPTTANDPTWIWNAKRSRQTRTQNSLSWRPSTCVGVCPTHSPDKSQKQCRPTMSWTLMPATNSASIPPRSLDLARQQRVRRRVRARGADPDDHGCIRTRRTPHDRSRNHRARSARRAWSGGRRSRRGEQMARRAASCCRWWSCHVDHRACRPSRARNRALNLDPPMVRA